MIRSVNPATNEIVAEFEAHTPAQVDQALGKAVAAQHAWAELQVSERADLVSRLGSRIRAERDSLARLATLEMGKPIVQAENELDKCADTCDYYAEHGPQFLAPEGIATTFDDAYVRFEPLGVILAVMPWNFPFWQVFRQLAPALVAGNAVVLKHASNVPQCSIAIQNLIRDCGFPEGLERSILISGSRVEDLIADPRVAAVSITGSSEVGAAVAAVAGQHLKKQILELGGSDPFIVLGDADLLVAAAEGSRSRNLNAGQSCVAAKRFLAEKTIHDVFVEQMAEKVEQLVVGDPFDRATDIGPLARPDLVSTLARQVEDSVAQGAKVVVGGDIPPGPGNFYVPAVVSNVTTEMPIFREETFGPAAPVLPGTGDEEIVSLANMTEFGLGASIWTRDQGRATAMARKLQVGTVFINGRVSSDPRLPFGGTKGSGYGRELGSFGIRELTNIKAVAVNK